MSSQSKAQLLTKVQALLQKRYKLGPRPDRLTVLEAVVYGICHEGTTREQANQALSRFKDDFFDWNEVRVSSLDEIQAVLAGLPDTENRAFRVRRFLRQLFEKTYGFAFDGLSKKPLKESVKILQEYDALHSDYVLATVIQQALGGHAIPVDAPMHRGLERLGAADHSADDHSLRSAIERVVPKNRGAEFADLMEELTHDVCVEGIPDCPQCELKKICPTGEARLVEIKANEKAAAKAAKVVPHVAATPTPPPSKAASPAKKAAPAAKPAPAEKVVAAAKSVPAPKAAPPKAAPAPAPAPKSKTPPPKGKTPRSK